MIRSSLLSLCVAAGLIVNATALVENVLISRARRLFLEPFTPNLQIRLGLKTGHATTTVGSGGLRPAGGKEEAILNGGSNSTAGDDKKIMRCTAEELSTVEGYLLDLDGTIYNPEGLLPGAVEFFDWADETKVPLTLLSNGFKTREGVAAKLAMEKFKINQAIPPAKIHTAGVALANYMKDHAPKGSKIFAVGTSIEYADGSKDFITRILKRELPAELYNSWDVRVDMTLDEVHHWAHLSRDKNVPVYVVMAIMGNPNDKFGDDPVTHRSGYHTMDYELMTKMNVLLRNNAILVAGAPDVADSQSKSDTYPNIDTAWPTMGGFESLLLTSSEMFVGTEKERAFHVNTGKGGNHGREYMMEPGVELLAKQKPAIRRENIMIIGDNFGTDIKAGIEAGVRTMLVFTGAHQLSDAGSWKGTTPTCYLENVGEVAKLLASKTSRPALRGA